VPDIRRALFLIMHGGNRQYDGCLLLFGAQRSVVIASRNKTVSSTWPVAPDVSMARPTTRHRPCCVSRCREPRGSRRWPPAAPPAGRQLLAFWIGQLHAFVDGLEEKSAHRAETYVHATGPRVIPQTGKHYFKTETLPSADPGCETPISRKTIAARDQGRRPTC